MLKITRRTEHRQITLDEFIRQKASMPYKSWRQTGKTCNFLLIFGGSAMLFSEETIEINWTREQAENYIKENHCEYLIDEVKAKYRKISDEELPFVVVATNIRNNFFKGYKGLEDRIYREQNFAKRHGYTRCVFGATRKVIELMLAGEWDQKHLSRMLKNLNNICANSEIQTMEAAITKRAIYELKIWMDENHFKSYVYNEIHDSADFVIYKPEAIPILKKFKELCERYIPEFGDSPVRLKLDCEVSDIKKGQYFKGGVSPEVYGIPWNEWEEEILKEQAI